MRIIVWGINYAPEVTGIGPHNVALCEFLQKNGHDVGMLTTFCYYPAWRKLPEDRGRLFRTDRVHDVTVHRCWHFVPRRLASWKRILHELSFVVASLLRLLTLPRADLLIVVSPPLLLGAAAWLAGWIKRTPFIFHVQDLQPDGALELGMLKPGPFAHLLRAVETFAYRKARRVSGISRGMLNVLANRGVPAGRLLYFPNTIALPRPGEIPARGLFRSRHGFQPDDFLAVYSGNLGVKHGLQTLVEAAQLLKNGRVKILIFGSGSTRESLAALIVGNGLKSIDLFPLLSEPEYHALLADADICLIPQRKGVGHSFFPSKLLNTLAFGKPVLTVADADSELVRVLGEGRFGVNVPPEEPQALASELERLAQLPDTLAEFGEAGRKFVAQFERERVFSEFNAAISEDH